MTIGHWFCLHCDDVCFMERPRPGHENATAKCNNCGHRTAQWVTGRGPAPKVSHPRRKASPDFARAFFNHIHDQLKSA